MPQETLRNDILLIAAPVLLLLGLTCAVLIDPYIRKKHRSVMLVILALVCSLILQNDLGYRLDRLGTAPVILTAISVFGYCVRPTILVLFYYIVGKRKKYRPAWILIGLNAAVHMTAFFSGICFRIDSENVFHRGPLGFCCHIVSGILLFYLIWLTVRAYDRARKRETLLPALNVLFIVGAVVIDSLTDSTVFPISFLTVAVVCSCVFYYIWLHLQFVREHEQALMAEQRIQIMMSQIQPHFLYNTLSTIQALCKTDPQKAFDTTEKFGAYLRQNIDSLSQPRLIPVEKELEHVRIYTEIETIRFPSIRVAYDVQDLDFRLPALTIQPLVENAIRHGVRIRDDGLVTVATRKTDAGHEITIRDNGKGFDVRLIERADGTHIGIRNVRARVEQICGGTLTVESAPDRGVTVTIRLPGQT